MRGTMFLAVFSFMVVGALGFIPKEELAGAQRRSIMSAAVDTTNAFADAADVKAQINSEMDKLYYIQDPDSGDARPWVCLVCDQFTGPNWETFTDATLKKRKTCSDLIHGQRLTGL